MKFYIFKYKMGQIPFCCIKSFQLSFFSQENTFVKFLEIIILWFLIRIAITYIILQEKILFYYVFLSIASLSKTEVLKLYIWGWVPTESWMQFIATENEKQILTKCVCLDYAFYMKLFYLIHPFKSKFWCFKTNFDA